jgi:hypothetical protein
MCDVGDEGLAGRQDQTVAVVDWTKPLMAVDEELIGHLEHVNFCGGLVLPLNAFLISYS